MDTPTCGCVFLRRRQNCNALGRYSFVEWPSFFTRSAQVSEGRAHQGHFSLSEIWTHKMAGIPLPPSASPLLGCRVSVHTRYPLLKRQSACQFGLLSLGQQLKAVVGKKYIISCSKKFKDCPCIFLSLTFDIRLSIFLILNFWVCSSEHQMFSHKCRQIVLTFQKQRSQLLLSVNFQTVSWLSPLSGVLVCHKGLRGFHNHHVHEVLLWKTYLWMC